MSIKQRLEQDLKQALLAGNKDLVTTLRGLKSAVQYVEVAQNKREEGLDDKAIIEIFGKEAKKRQESADLYQQGGEEERKARELAEKAVIEGYLPQQLSEAELMAIVDDVVREKGPVTSQSMGQIIGLVKVQTAGQADGAAIAQEVKKRMST
jgi:uncharacterized protein YqeY